PYHESRLTGLLILVEQFTRNKETRFRQACVEFYLSHTDRINNWDLVDLSCYKLLGVWLEDKERQLLYRLADSDNLWEQRIAMVTCMHFVHQGDFKDCLALADRLLHHRHDLIHKAVGWLLREVGKKDRNVLVRFLETRYQEMPRTMLRYAIEHFPETERKKYLSKPAKDSNIH
ncbi:MAG: DNA alkylation repair protein, partial [Odoribacter sp.]|nr:DNA alkylation repair protein [Odoribacter sp.]